MSDTVVQVHPVTGGDWTNLGQAGDAVSAAGNVVAFTTPESEQGNTDLNGDGDTVDRVLQVYSADTAALTNVAQTAEDFVVGEQALVAFRTREARQGNQVLNDDGDTLDDVLQVYDAVSLLGSSAAERGTVGSIASRSFHIS